ncbi:MAG: phosphodiesterase [Actinobacteria bacterium]|nr:phosphodiesterase [Actinomycetota bacterium]
MRIGAISDTHGDTQAWERALVVFTGCGLVVHAGDILYHGPFNPILPTYSPRDLASAINEAPFPMVFAKGNCDSEVDQLALSFPIQQPMALIHLQDASLIVLHGDKYDEKGLERLGKEYGVDIVVRGHTHDRLIEKVDDLVIMNPGSSSIPKEGPPSVAIIDTDARRINILNLENRKPIADTRY